MATYGAAWTKMRNQRIKQAALNDEPCCRCGSQIDYTLKGNSRYGPTLDHLHPLSHGGTLLAEPDLLAPAHNHCNSRHGGRIGNRSPTRKGKAKREMPTANPISFGAPREPSPAVFKKTPGHVGINRHPAGFVLPRIWTVDDSTELDYTIADGALAWMDSDACPGPPLLPWQRFVVREALATRDGSWRYRRVVLRLARQQGKTTLVRSLLSWMLLCGSEVLGEPQRILNTHPDAKQAVELMKPVANAMGYGQDYGRRKILETQVFMAVWFPGGVLSDTAPVWMSRAMTDGGLTGNRGLTVTFVDELQDAGARQVQEGLGGALSSARVRHRQQWFAGTGEKPGSELLRRMRSLMWAEGTLWAEWSMPPGSDPDDEASWEWASPDWSVGRLEYLRDERRTMPADAFQRNYLLSDDAAPPAGLVPVRVWDGLRADPLPAVSVGVEAAAGGLPVVVSAGRAGDGRVVLSARQAGSMGEAVGWCRELGVAPLVGKSLLHDPGWREVGAVPMSGTGSQACSVLLQLVADGVLGHDGSEVLGGQVTSTTAVSGPTGLRVTSGGRVDAIKAGMWAAESARQVQTWYAY